MEISLNIAQKQMLSQNQIQSLNILEMTNVELSSFLYDEYLGNPLMEYTPGSGKAIQIHKETDVDEGSRRDPDEWKRQFLYQLNEKDYTKEEWCLFRYLVECLDEDGYFLMSAKEISDITGCSQELVEKSLCRMKELEPVGVFSFNLSECLLKQLQVLGIEDENLIEIAAHHLSDVAGGYINRVTRNLGISTLQVKKYINMLRQLNPKPLLGLVPGEEKFVTPDVILQLLPKGWEVTINDDWMGNYAVSDYYLKMMQEAVDPELMEYFKNKLERSRFLIQCVEQRRNSILQIVNVIATLQAEYLCGRGDLKPMTMTAVAAESDIHVSTVSRAIKDKYLQTEKKGTILIKDLFSQSVSRSDSEHETVNSVQIKRSIKTVIEEEDCAHPCSDQKIADLLAGEGMPVARRTVAKYREELGIPSAHERKDIL